PWGDAGQPLLLEAMAALRALVEKSLSGRGELVVDPVASERYRRAVAAFDEERADTSPLSHVCRAFGLSPFERDLLLLCASVHVDSVLMSTFAEGHPTFAFAHALFPGGHLDALLPEGPLRRHRLLTVDRDSPLFSAPLRIDQAVLSLLLGGSPLDQQLG